MDSKPALFYLPNSIKSEFDLTILDTMIFEY